VMRSYDRLRSRPHSKRRDSGRRSHDKKSHEAAGASADEATSLRRRTLLALLPAEAA